MSLLDLDRLRQVAEAGKPQDAVVVTRRWLGQACEELMAGRGQAPALDHDRYCRAHGVRRMMVDEGIGG
ncbi:hypothetical protein [Sphingomonas sp. GM_Shp_2]|uniref:hypothetical protein n=1 Tax=Sphingomonas sp. GM_Shp_2 TaxID=2937380 RepID=UPI00226AF473|nr:hypothetical protein [Sphingomonas sp. GM_Shp_2]